MEIRTVLFFRKKYRRLRENQNKEKNAFLECEKNQREWLNDQNKHETNRFFGMKRK